MRIIKQKEIPRTTCSKGPLFNILSDILSRDEWRRELSHESVWSRGRSNWSLSYDLLVFKRQQMILRVLSQEVLPLEFTLITCTLLMIQMNPNLIDNILASWARHPKLRDDDLLTRERKWDDRSSCQTDYVSNHSDVKWRIIKSALMFPSFRRRRRTPNVRLASLTHLYWSWSALFLLLLFVYCIDLKLYHSWWGITFG